MVVKVKVSGHNVKGQGRCDGAERLRWCRVIWLNSVKKSSKIKDKIKVKVKIKVMVKVKVKVKVIGMV